MPSEDEKKLKELETLQKALKSAKDEGTSELEKMIKEAKSLQKELQEEEE